MFFAPYDLYHELNALSAAYKIDDREGVVENGLRTVEAPFNISNAFMKLSIYAINFGVFFKAFDGANFAPIIALTSPLSKLITITGFILCVIEGVLESIGLIRSADLYNDIYQSEKEELKENQVSAHAFFLTNLHKTYFQIPSEELKEIDEYVKNKLSDQPIELQEERKKLIIETNLDLKKSALIRRVQPWLADRIEETLPQILVDLQSVYGVKVNEAKEKAESIFNNIKIQTEKNLLIYSIGITAVLFTVAGLLAECVLLLHLMIPVILLGVGGVLAISRGLLYLGLKDCEGWDFSIQNCIPDKIKMIYNDIAAERNKTIEPRFALSYSYIVPGSEYDIALKNFEASRPVLKFPSLKDYGIVR